MSGESASASAVLDFPFERVPEPAELFPIADSVFWIRMPLPGMPGHINLWAIKGEREWTMVDTGLANQCTTKLWQQIWEQYPIPVKQLARVIATHYHPDHVGLAGWLTTHRNTELWMSQREYLYCHHMLRITNTTSLDVAIAHFRASGLNEEQLETFAARFGSFEDNSHDLPHSYRQLVDNQKLILGDREWRVITGSGHSPDHVCLLCPELKLFISGDQLLPGISSNVSVLPTEPQANPLGDWLHSCRKLLRLVPENVLVLPAHGLPFRGAHSRLHHLIEEREENLAKVVVACKTPQRAVDLFPLLFRTQIGQKNAFLAAGESIAYLNYLIDQGLVSVDRDENGVNHYSSN